MSRIKFKVTLFQIGSWTLVTLPQEASTQLSSRGMAFAEGTLNGVHIQVPLEPDGRGGHWFRINDSLLRNAKAAPGDTVSLEIEPIKVWPLPEAPEDLRKGLAKVPEAQILWADITPNAQWD